MGKTKRREATSKNSRKNDDDLNCKSEKGKPRKNVKDVKAKQGGGGGRKSRAAWISHLESDLSKIGLRVQEVAADGDCFFHSLADQLVGRRTGDHRALRHRIVTHIKQHRELYEWFIEDDEAFDDYVERMAEEGTWAGHIECQAATLELGVRLRIYQAGQPSWTIKNHQDNDDDDNEPLPMLHLSYHDGVHYNSVRLADDFGDGPPERIPSEQQHSLAAAAGGGGVNSKWSERDVRRVKEGTGCAEEEKIMAALETAGGDVDAAIEKIIEGMVLLPSDGSCPVTSITEMIDVQATKTTSCVEDACEEEFNQLPVAKIKVEVCRGGQGRRARVLFFCLNGTTGEYEEHGGGGGAPPKRKESKLEKKAKKKAAKEKERLKNNKTGNDDDDAVLSLEMQTLYI